MIEKAAVDAARYLQLWRLIGWVLGWVGALLGTGYAAFGDSGAQTPSLYLFRTYGGIRLYGALMAACGFLLLLAMATGWRHLRRSLEVFCGFSTLWALQILGSWYLAGRFVWGGPVVWFAFAALAAGMIRWPPVGYRQRP